MGFGFNRPPLPAPTEPSTLSSADDTNLRDELDTNVSTNVSTRTDKTSYSIPEDGRPITINTTKVQGLHKRYPSQTSLLIEYFEGAKNEDGESRPSVRVRVTPSSRKSKSKSKSSKDSIPLSLHNRHHSRRPAYTRRISLGNQPREDILDTLRAGFATDSEVSSLHPVDIEVLQDHEDPYSDSGYFLPMTSDVSSMPADSMLGATPPEILPPGPSRRRSRSLERDTVAESVTAVEPENLKAPKHQRSRSLSKDRITQRVMEKLQQQAVGEGTSKLKAPAKEDVSSSRKHRRRSKDVEEHSAVSGTDSSLLSSNGGGRSGVHSSRSAVSGTSSINNPKLLATVEDAIRRLILPELNALKEENRTSRNKDKFEQISRDSGTSYERDEPSSREHSRRRVSKSSSAPKLHGNKAKGALGRDDAPEIVVSKASSRKGERKSSRGSTSERSYTESTRDEKSHRRRSKEKSSSSTRDVELAGLAGAGLTAAALRHHTSREEKEEERKHRKRRSSKSSRSISVSESLDDEYMKAPVPPLPFNHSELLGSEMTRESILSAETETKRPRSDSQSSKSTLETRGETPLNEVNRARGYISPGPLTPTRTPNALQRSLGLAQSNRSTGEVRLPTPKSDRSYSSRSKEVTQASLEAAAAAKARAIERTDPQASQYEIDSGTPTRGVSPIQSEASYRESAFATGSPRRTHGSIRSGGSVSSMARQFEKHQSDLSIASLESRPSTKAARTRKRPQGVTLESKRSILGEADTPREADEFFERNHETNEAYRREMEDSSLASPVNRHRLTGFTDDSGDIPYLDRDDKMDIQDIQRVDGTPEYVHTPLAVESAVASLHDPSNISVRSSIVSSPVKKSRLSQVSPSPGDYDIEPMESPSRERWGAIRDQAEAALAQRSPHAADNSPRQSIAESIDKAPQMTHSAFPTGHDDMLPEFGYGIDDASDVTTNPSIIQGPGGDGYHDQADDVLAREERERTPTSFSKGAAAVGLGVGAAAVAAHHLHNKNSASYDDRHQPTVEDEFDQNYPGEPQYEQPGYSASNRTPLSGFKGDEGYQSANQRDAHDFPNRKTFDDDGLGDEFDDLESANLFGTAGKHNRHVSGNSHGMASPLYDAATGKGIDRIQSKDIVALMDHLTVRDAQRNARDTEILVTLVRSAAEMRNQLDEMKQFMKVQDNMILQTTDKRIGLAEQRIIGGSRPLGIASPKLNRSLSEDVDADTKKKSVFKRALKGLSLKGDSDIKNIEAMLVQLLGEVEGLKQTQQLTIEQTRTNSMTSYENLRASGDPGYEPEGRANTASSPNQSGYLSNPASSGRRIQDLHSGYDVIPTNRISTVQEESDEEYNERVHPYENTERMTTPTQEAYQDKLQETPPKASRFRDSQSNENTPQRERKHKSNSSSIFGIPKISRWSKTTASTNVESLPRNSGSGEKRPYSTHSIHSRTNSDLQLDEYDDEYDEPYEVRDDDRLRSKSTLAREDRASIRSARSARSARTPSPLIPEEFLEYEMEDPKYQAHRNSLNLQHPQPRAGPTGRHHNQLESQARVYEPVQSPDYDQWGSMPALARNRMSGGQTHGAGNLSPISSEGGYSEESASDQQQAPPRPPKIPDDGPLVPTTQQTLAGYGQTRQMYSSPNEFGSQGVLTPLAPIAEVRYSLETDRGHRASPTPSPQPGSHYATARMNTTPQRKITGPRPMGSRSPNPAAQQSGGLTHSDTVIRRKPVAADEESLLSYRSSLDSEIF